jgi:hypothetical protein
MILDANAQEAAALLDLLDKAQRAGGLNVSYWCLHWAQKVKTAEAAAHSKPELVKGESDAA